MAKDSLELTVGTDGGPISVVELGEFLITLRGTYTLAWYFTRREFGSQSAEPVNIQQAQKIAALMSASVGKRPMLLDEMAFLPLPPEEDMVLLAISRENPLKLLLGGSVMLLCVAAVFGGGEIEMGVSGVKAKIHSLGEGIASLRRGIAPVPAQVQTGPEKEPAGSSSTAPGAKQATATKPPKRRIIISEPGKRKVVPSGGNPVKAKPPAKGGDRKKPL